MTWSLYDWCQVVVLDEDGEYLVDIIQSGFVAVRLCNGASRKGKIPTGALGQKIRLEFNFSSDGGQDNGPQYGLFIDSIAITTK